MTFRLFGRKQPKTKFKCFLGHTLEGKPAHVRVQDGDSDDPTVDLTVHITEKCNFSCSHCYVSSGPAVKDQLLKEEIIRVIDQSSRYDCAGILFTGGEPFLHPDLDAIIEHTKGRISPISIFTNGSWVSDMANTVKRLKELRRLGCDHVKFSIDDRYHREFMPEEKIEVIKRIISLQDRSLPVLETNHEKERVSPMGNALSMPESKLDLNDPENEIYYDMWFGYCSLQIKKQVREAALTIRANGDVYSCSFYVKPIGNIKTDALSRIIDSFFTDETYSVLAEFGPQELARRKGMPEEEIKKRFLEHPCKFCHDLVKGTNREPR